MLSATSHFETQQPTVDFEKLKDSFDNDGLFEAPDYLLSEEEWERLEALTQEDVLPYHEINLGDAGEPNKVRVGRFVVDQDVPTQVNHGVSQEALQILTNPRLAGFLGQFLGEKCIYVRRAQVNLMSAGAFVGEHLDTESNPDYRVAVVLQLGREFKGGAFAVRGARGLQIISPKHRSIIISNCQVPHAVEEVTAGTRRSLVFFVSGYGGVNRRDPKSVPMDCDTNRAIEYDLARKE